MKRERLYEVSRDLAETSGISEEEARGVLLSVIQELPDAELEKVTAGVGASSCP